MNQERPLSGSVWLHEKSGNHYQVILTSNMLSESHDEYPPMVTYRRLSDLSIWSRPIARWHSSMTFVANQLNGDYA